MYDVASQTRHGFTKALQCSSSNNLYAVVLFVRGRILCVEGSTPSLASSEITQRQSNSGSMGSIPIPD